MEEAIPSVTSRRRSYRDEMNFAEFPLASISDRLPDDQKTLTFTDTIFDQGSNKPVTRTLTISASDEYGLPTALDDEVILGLIQLTNQADFQDRKVHFTRYELLKLLGWSDDTKSYARISESLKRWLGVTLYYDKAWWSKEEQCWVSENFHILDQVTIFDKERRERRVKTKKGDPDAGRSSFVWNEVVYDSFQAGYLKQIDMDFFKSLDSAISKRIYRFLDKRFYKRESLVFDLREFALEHIGLNRNYQNSEIKRRLAPAIKELEEKGLLEKLPPKQRFEKKSRGVWTVTFKRSKGKQAAIEVSLDDPPLVSELTERGITRATARKLVEGYSDKLIEEKIELVDWLVERADKRVSNNPAGYLYRAIEEDYALPQGFESKEQKREKEEKKRKEEALRKAKEAKKERKLAAKQNSERELLDSFWNGLTEEEQAEFEDEAVKLADKFLSEQYRKGRGDQGLLFKTVRQSILDSHIRRKLQLPEAA